MPVPLKGVQETAQRAVRWIEEGHAGDNFTDTGRGRAHQLADAEEVDEETMRRMCAYFRRHAVDKEAEGFTGGEDGFPSPGRVAWDAWGGGAGQRWVESQLDD